MNGNRLNLINLEDERVRKVNFNFNNLFMEKLRELLGKPSVLVEVKKQMLDNGKNGISRETLLAVNAFNQNSLIDLFKTLQIVRIKVQNFFR